MSKWNPSIFREYDIRGLAEKELNSDFAECLGRAYGRHLLSAFEGQKPLNNRARFTVSVGRDARLTGENYMAALTKGILSTGIDVIRLGIVPTPVTYFSLFHLELDGGIMVTGSHNPAEYNGFKICLRKDSMHGKAIQVLRERMEADATIKASNQLGVASDYDILTPYIEYVSKNVGPLKKLKIVLDAGNGVGGLTGPQVFKNLGAEVIPLFCELDGRFPNHHPDPTVLKNLEDLRKKVLSEKADFGIAFDGDADRIGVVDESGNAIFGDELMVIYARDILKRKPGSTFISEVKCSYRLYQDIEKRGGRAIMWKTGHSLIKSKMKEEHAELAGEMSGHIFFQDGYFGFDDAIYAAARLYKIVASQNGKISSLISDLEKTVSTPEIRIDCDEGLKFKLVETAKNILKKDYKVNEIDGLRIDLPTSWGLCRASNTQPVLVLRFEAANQIELDRLRNIVTNALVEAAKTIHHPPMQFDGGSNGH